MSAARVFVRELLEGKVPAETVDAAESVASELVTNAVVHAGTDVEIEARVESPSCVYLAVFDRAPHHPVRQRSGVERSTGRGLALVGSLTQEWGVVIGSGGKVVWCRLDAAATSPRGTPYDGSQAGTLPAEPELEVALVNVPLSIFRSWSEGAEALLRDYLLAGLETTDLEDSLRRHAACSEALALLVEAVVDVPPATVGEATARDDGYAKVNLSIPARSVEHFVTLNDVLESAIEPASTEEYLAAATSPTAQSLRRWLCREVLVQSCNGQPTPWDATARTDPSGAAAPESARSM